MNFDKKTRTTTVESLLTGMEASSLLEYVRLLAVAVSGGEEGEEGASERRIWAVDALYALSKHPTVAGDASMTATVLRLCWRCPTLMQARLRW